MATPSVSDSHARPHPATDPLAPRRLVGSQVAIDAHALSADGAWAVYVRRTVTNGEYRRHLWRISTDGGAATRMTSGRVRDIAPAISPDGRWIAFLRTAADPRASEADRTAQAWVMPSDGGRPWRLGGLPAGVSGLAWSPRGDRLALVAAAPGERTLIGRRVQGVAPIGRRITRMDVRDDEGFRDHRAHLWLVHPRRGARPSQLTNGDFDVEEPAWSPDGSSIVFAADLTPDAGLNPQTVLCVVGADGGPMRRVAALRGDLHAPAFSPDARWLAAIGTDLADPPEATQPELWLFEVATGQARSLTAPLDLPVGVWTSTHLTRATQPQGPDWLDDHTIAVLLTRRGRSLPWRISLDGSAEPMLPPERHVVASGLRVAGGRVVVNAQVDGRPHDLYRVEAGHLRRLTRNGAAWRSRLRVPQLEELEVPGPAGPIQLWLFSPPGAGREPMPTILDLHGGPTGSWGPGAGLDVLALAGKRYRVARPNIRGSAGFGAAWVDGLGAAWGDVDAADALAVADWLVAERLADPRRLGVMGLSYGGFLTNWLVGVTDRFAAAVSENGVTNQATAWAECYFGIYDARRTGLGDPLSDEGMQALWSRSPLRHVSAIHTPLLMLQAEEDRICPASDNIQLFAALRALGREVEYILYPEEHHVFGSIGRPDRRVDRLERIIAWFARAFD